MAIFGRMTARQRLRRATRESLAMPAFSSPIDCTPWVIGGLWPAELSTITAENATLADYLKTDLQRIADSANEQLKMVKRAGLADFARQAEEARVIDEARARAVRRVESTIRQLHAAKAGVTAGHLRPQAAEPQSSDMDQTQVIAAVPNSRPSEAPTRDVRRPRWRVADKPAPSVPQGGDEAEAPVRDTAVEQNAGAPDMEETQVIPAVTQVEPVVDAPTENAEPDWEPVANGRHHLGVEEPATEQDQPERGSDIDAADGVAGAPMEETQVIPAITDAEPVVDEPDSHHIAEDDTPATSMEATQVIPAITEAEPVVDEPVANGRHHAVSEEPASAQDDAQQLAQQPEPVEDSMASMEETQIIPAITEPEPVVDEPAEGPASQDEPDAPQEPAARPSRQKDTAATSFDTDRLNRLLEFVVRQESRLNWAVGELLDGTTVLVTDLAHGWIPAGINLPAGVRLLEPERRTGRVSALIGDAARVVTYAPGDSLRRSPDFTATKSSLEPRELPLISDLARVLSETTRRFDGLPRIVQRLADAAAAEAVVIDQEVDVLRVHLDTARYQLLVQYPTVNPALLLKCLLMAATEGIASGDAVSANYHLAWYQKLAAQAPAP
uniref:DUF5631 domain-containing protein n=1 Tax=Mycobacterium sp. 852014-50255_SCH5639931 TaxID=1834112 RepID=UPI0007FC56D2|nr:DUF5631 domain-containing protein [Mycobacterium sp. 852014-50255_SCH5639931]OBB68456.1 hypothetical protein A5758_08150 [Mycobacterium sp. 852014-50255_SCH5639931]